MRHSSLCLLLLLCLGGAEANLVVNPSFDDNFVNATDYLFVASGSVNGWNAIGSGNIELWATGHGGVSSYDGTNLLEIDVDPGSYDGIYQTVSTTPGKQYILSFYMRARSVADAATDDEAVDVEWNDVSIGVYNAAGAAWEVNEITVTGTGSDKLTFRELETPAGSDGEGPLLDMVELVALSESPSAYPTDVPSQTPTGSPTNSAVLPMDGGGGGDPHFKTWTGLRYDYHGECDLVFLKNPYFDHGRGLYIHIRTVRKGYYSYIERAALQVGDDRLEFVGMNEWYNNGVMASTKPRQRLGKYKLRVHTKAVSIRIDEKEKIKIDFAQRRNGFIYLVVDGRTTDVFKGSLGMIGQWVSGQMVARDGATVLSDPDTMAQEWQVRGTDPQLFRVNREPQYPVACRPPKKMLGDRLGSSMMRRRAENVCKSRPFEEESECIFDVMATRDINAAAY